MPDSIIGRISVGDGATFTPSVSTAGELSWTNNKNLPNPDPVDIAQAVVDKKPGWGIPIGFEYFSINPNVPQGALPLFGGEYSRETYSDLWAWVQQQTGYLKTEAQWQSLATSNNGNVPYYSDGDGSTTFRVPSLKCWVKSANGTVTEVGSYLAAGLPNINGSALVDPSASTSSTSVRNYSGAFEKSSTGNIYKYATNGTITTDYGLKFNASNSNSIYGNSNTVQPESIVGMWLVKAYGTIVDTGTIDEQQYIDDRFNASKQYTDDSVSDLKTDYLPANYLPLAGGTMTGAITESGWATVVNTADSSSVLDFSAFASGSQRVDGASLVLFGKTHAGAGRFDLYAGDGTNSKILRGKADGSLTWNDQRIDNNIIDFKSSVTFNETPARSQFIKCGRIVTIMYQGESKAHSTNDVLFKIPTAYVPYDVSSLGQYLIVGTVNQTAMTFIIAPNGSVTCGASASGRAYIQVSYICG